MSQQWDARTTVWGVISPEYGLKLYASKREAQRAAYRDSIVSEFTVWQELTKDWTPMFKEDS